MQTSLVVLLVAAVIGALVAYRLGFKRPPEVLQTRSQAAFVVLALLLIPVLVLVLWAQAGAKRDLAAIGIRPHPSLSQSLGVATGAPITGERVWVFRSRESAEAILRLYRDPQSRTDWQLDADSEAMLVLRRGSQRLTIAAGPTHGETVVSYSLARAETR